MNERTNGTNTTGEFIFDPTAGRYVEKKKEAKTKQKSVAVIYVRVSTDKQKKVGYGLQSQEFACRNECKKLGCEIEKVFIDVVKGETTTRKGLRECIEYVKKQNKKTKKITHLVCSEYSRISRKELKGEEGGRAYLDGIKDLGIIVYAAKTPIDPNNKMAYLLETIHLWNAHQESENISNRTKNGLKARLSNGFYPFASPVGYAKKHIKLEGRMQSTNVPDDSAPIVKEGLEMYATGMIQSKKDLLDYFNEHKLQSNFHSSNPGKLRSTFVTRLLDDKKLLFYAGFIVKPDYGILEPIKGRHLPIISQSTAYAILEKKKNTGVIRKTSKYPEGTFPLAGKVLCTNCGAKMHCTSGKGKLGKVYYYYTCRNSETSCKNRTNADKLHNEFELFLQSLKPKKKVLDIFKHFLDREIKGQKKLYNELKKKKKYKLVDVKQKIRNVTDKLVYEEGDVYEALSQKLVELNGYKAELEYDIGKEMIDDADFKHLLFSFLSLIENPISIWNLGSNELREILIGVLFNDKISYTKKSGMQTPEKSVIFSIFSQFDASKERMGRTTGIEPATTSTTN